MARITPKSSAVPTLNEFEPYVVQLQSVELQPPGEYGPSVKFVLQVAGNPDDTLYVWAGVALGKASTGKVAKLRSMLNAFAGRNEAEVITWFEDEDFTYGYADGSICTLRPGDPVTIRGRMTPRAEGGDQFTVEYFTPAPGVDRSRTAASVRPAAVPFG